MPSEIRIMHNSISSHLQQFLQREVSANNESIVWTGKPNPGAYMKKSIPIVLFAIPWTAFAIFWMFGAASFGDFDGFNSFDDFFFLFGTPFVLIGIGMFLSPIYQRQKALNTIYAITNKRILIIQSGFFSKENIGLQSFTKDDIEMLERQEKSNGMGNIFFKKEVRYGSKGSTYIENIGFWGIKNVRAVESHLQNLKNN